MTYQKQINHLKQRILINDIIIFIFLGIFLNLLVIIFNNNQMPVYFNENVLPIVPNGYIAFNNFNQVNYSFLGDIFRIYKLRFSIGDILIFSGMISLFIITILNFYRRFKNGNNIINE